VWGRYIPLFWRLFVPNAAVLLAACIVLMVEPANGRVVALIGGLLILLTVNLFLMRRAFAPLSRLAALMHAIDPLAPGRRLPALGPESEVSRLTDAFNEMLDRLETERRESGYRALVAEEAERRRVAAELHDEIGQRLTALVLELDHLAKIAPSELNAELVGTTVETKETLEVVRRVARRLRPEVLDELGLVPALRNLCDRFEGPDGPVVHRTLATALPPLEEDAELVIYRVAQESLTNVIRHARARHVQVTIDRDAEAVCLLVRDDGVGIDTSSAAGSPGGIRGMRERAMLIGARLELEALPAGGTEVRLHVPAR
jgi:two-component system, NarL family, sensor histidine kinase UhpB